MRRQTKASPTRLVAFGLLLLTIYMAFNVLTLGGAIWSAQAVDTLAVVTPQGRAETRERLAIIEAVQAARLDWVHRVIRPNFPCQPLTLEFRVRGGWVTAPLECTSGLLFDYLPRDAWQPIPSR